MALSVIILIGLPLTAFAAFLVSFLQRNGYDKQMLSFVFSTKCYDTERELSVVVKDLELVNQLTDDELKNEVVWQQSKL